ncbi:hypothetical protein TWF718_002402 [Orbilia javanica]|uniref:Peptidase A1 domain-containing protein n=1 Tax=Orbilia javanica TaxID=47235 RepID=A0AAN8RJQ4_9PEZI
MFSNINTFSWFALSSLLSVHVSEAVAIPRFGNLDGKIRRDLSKVVQRSPISPRQDATARGLVQPIWLSDDGLRYYTNVSFGTPPQPLTLALSLDGTTWAPTLPAGVSVESYCADAENDVACSYARISGFYTIPGSVTYSPRGDYEELQVDSEDTVNGIQATEHIQLRTSVLANVGLAIANSWASAPQLSLSSLPTSGNPGQQLLSVLQQAGFINTLTYSLAFTSIDRRGNVDYASGELSFGGIDETQFSGELSSFEGGNNTDVGVLPVSNIYWIGNKAGNVSIIDEDSDAGHLGVGHVSLTPYLWIPDAMFEIIVSLFADVEKPENSEVYGRNCTSPLEDLDVESLQISIDGTFITVPIDLLFFPTAGENGLCNLAIRPISDYPTATTADYILGFPFLRTAYTVFDHTHRRTHLAPRRVVFSSTSDLTPVGEGNATVSGVGASLSTKFTAATTTLSVPLHQLSETPSTTTATTTSASATPTETKVLYYYEPPKSKPNIGAIVGGVVGAVVFLATIIVLYPLLKAANQRRKRRSQRKSKAGEKSRTSSANDLSPVDSNQNGEENENDEDGDEKEDVDAITTAIAIANSKKDMPGSGESNRNSVAGARDSVTVNITEIDEASSRGGGRNSSDVKSMNTFGESEKN